MSDPEKRLAHGLPVTPTAEDPESAFFSKRKPVHAPRLISQDVDPKGADKLGLTAQEAEQFRQTGFVIKRGLIPKEDFSPFINLWWQQPPVLAAKMSCNDPASW